MTILLSLLLIAGGIYLLTKGADYLVDGATAIALKNKIRPIIIGLTIVAFGTSMPEFVVSFVSALSGSTDIMLGNVVGSNIFNILGVLGVTAIVAPLVVQKDTIYKEVPFSLLGALLLFSLATQVYIDNSNFSLNLLKTNQVFEHIGLVAGLILISQLVIFMYYVVSTAKDTDGGVDVDTIVIKFSTRESVVYIISGLALLILGGRATVLGAVSIANILGISEQIIGLTIVAIGTSLPELVTSIAAARKGQDDIAVGNVVGSNIFNIFFVLAVPLLFTKVPITGPVLQDLLVLIATTLLLFVLVFSFKKMKVGRIEGVIMVLCYVAYTVFLFVR